MLLLLHPGTANFTGAEEDLLGQYERVRVLQFHVSRVALHHYAYVWEMEAAEDGTAPFVFHYPKRSEYTKLENGILFLLDRLLARVGYSPLPPSEAQRVLPHLETECLERGQVTVFNLLFGDLWTVH